MKLFQISSILLFSGIVLFPMVTVAQAEKDRSEVNAQNSNTDIQQPVTLEASTPQPSTRAADLLVQSTNPTKITGIKLNPTPTTLEVILETDTGTTFKPITRTEDNTWIAEIDNAVLTLPDGKEFTAVNPTEGVSAVNITQIAEQKIQVQVVGTEVTPNIIIKGNQSPAATTPSDGTEEGEEELVVTGDRSTPGYRVPNTSTATGTDAPIMETPFSVQVIPKEVIRDQQATRIEEAIGNISGVYTLGTDSGRDANFNIRGFGSRFGSRVPVLRDGFRQYGALLHK